MSHVTIRLERAKDRDAAVEVERRAFASDEEPGIVETVRDEDGSFALVAEVDGAIVGHVQCSRARVGDDDVVALGPIGVLPERQGRGVGSALVRAALEEARTRDEVAMILLGDPGFYGRLGFGPAAQLGLRNPYAGLREGDFEIHEEDFQIAELGPGARALSGPVRWHAAFGEPG